VTSGRSPEGHGAPGQRQPGQRRWAMDRARAAPGAAIIVVLAVAAVCVAVDVLDNISIDHGWFPIVVVIISVRRTVVRLVTAPAAVLAAFCLINAHYGYWPTVGALRDKPSPGRSPQARCTWRSLTPAPWWRSTLW
jgi:hypothetical protein